MKIEIRNLQVNNALSDETNCFSATVYIDGKPAFLTGNRGHGGCDDTHPVQGYTGPNEAAVDAWLAANMAPDGPWTDTTPRPAYDMGHTCTLETFVNRLVEAAISEKEDKRIRRAYDKKLADRICAMNEQGDFLIFGKAIHKPTPANLATLRAKQPAMVILNDADDATKEKGLLAYCPGYRAFDVKAERRTSDDGLRAGVFERLAADTLTVADAKWLLARPENRGDATVDDAKLQAVVTNGEAAYAAYCAERDQARKVA